MNSKIIENFCYEGLGFPVDLAKVEMIEIDNEWYPKMDVRKIAIAVMNVLPFQDSKFTGNQVRFIRNYFSMSLRQFGEEVVHETHSAVDKWEKCGEKMTSMNDNTEGMLRLYILEQQIKTIKQKEDFFKKYQKVKNFFTATNKTSFGNHLKIENFACF